MGVHNLIKVLDEQYYNELEGGILESLGKLFSANTKVYVYPSLSQNHKEPLMTCNNLEIKDNLYGLFTYLLHNKKIMDIEPAHQDNLKIISDNVLSMIKNHQKGWESFLPKEVVKAIKSKRLFGYYY